jgi:hypothetical protein
MGPADLVNLTLELTNYVEHLKKNENWEMRFENVQELIAFATQQQSGPGELVHMEDMIATAEGEAGGETTKRSIARKKERATIAAEDAAFLKVAREQSLGPEETMKVYADMVMARESKPLKPQPMATPRQSHVIEIDDWLEDEDVAGPSNKAKGKTHNASTSPVEHGVTEVFDVGDSSDNDLVVEKLSNLAKGKRKAGESSRLKQTRAASSKSANLDPDTEPKPKCDTFLLGGFFC